MRIEPSELAGRRLDGVTAEWHEYEGVRSEDSIHLWLSVQGLSWLRLSTRSGLTITGGDAPGDDVDMDLYGRIVVESSVPELVANKIGQKIDHVELLEQFHEGRSIGIVGAVLGFHSGEVGIADLGDELRIATWPGPWSGWNVAIRA